MRTSTFIKSVTERPLAWRRLFVPLLLVALVGTGSVEAEPSQVQQSVVRVLLKYSVPGLVHEGQFIAQPKLVAVNEYMGVVVDSRGFVASYAGPYWRQLGDPRSSLIVETGDGKQFAGKLVGVDQRISLIVLKADFGKNKPAVLGKSLADKQLQLYSFNSEGRLQSTGVQVLNLATEATLPDIRIKTRNLAATGSSKVSPGSSVWDPEYRFLGFVTESQEAALNPNLAAYSILPAPIVHQSVKEVTEKQGDILAGYLGIITDPEVRTGVRVQSVVLGTPAYEAGLRQGDYIRSINGMMIKRSLDFRRALQWTGAGGTARFSVASDDEIKELSAKLIPYPMKEKASFAMALEIPRVWQADDSQSRSEQVRIYPVPIPTRLDLGLDVDPVTPQLAKFLKSPVSHGLLVKEVLEGSPAQKFGFSAGDILVEINGVGLASSHKLTEVVGENRDGVFVVRFVREGTLLTQKIVLQ